jgi:hypothetical protein
VSDAAITPSIFPAVEAQESLLRIDRHGHDRCNIGTGDPPVGDLFSVQKDEQGGSVVSLARDLDQPVR